MFKNASGNWTDFRKLEPTPVEINFHVEGDDSAKPPYYEIMQDNAKTTIDALRTAQANGDGTYCLYMDRALHIVVKRQLDQWFVE